VSIVFFAAGIPVAQGSKRVVPLRHRTTKRSILDKHGNPRVNLIEASTGLAEWRKTVARQAKVAMLDSGVRGYFDRQPVSLQLEFLFVRPKHPANPYPPPDIDKLERAILDSLTGILYTNDKQVTSVIKSKRYLNTSNSYEHGGPGIIVSVG